MLDCVILAKDSALWEKLGSRAQYDTLPARSLINLIDPVSCHMLV